MLPEWSWWSRSACCLWCSGSTDEAGRTRWKRWGKPESTDLIKSRFVWQLVKTQTADTESLTLLRTAMCVMNCMMGNQMPMSWARSTTGRRYSITNFWASRRISIQLLMSAKRGARGHAATKMVMKPNWMTEEEEEDEEQRVTGCFRSQLFNFTLSQSQQNVPCRFTFLSRWPGTYPSLSIHWRVLHRPAAGSLPPREEPPPPPPSSPYVPPLRPPPSPPYAEDLSSSSATTPWTSCQIMSRQLSPCSQK